MSLVQVSTLGEFGVFLVLFTLGLVEEKKYILDNHLNVLEDNDEDTLSMCLATVRCYFNTF